MNNKETNKDVKPTNIGRLSPLRLILFIFIVGFLILAAISFYSVNAQMPSRVRALDVNFVPEPGCPVAVINGRTELDLDPFDIPTSARIYIDYKNNSDRTISAVKFRIRFVDPGGKDRGTMHAAHMTVLGPGQQSTEKWKHERVDPRASGMLIRVLQARFQDGGHWHSAKMTELAAPHQDSGGSGGALQGGSQTGDVIPPAPGGGSSAQGGGSPPGQGGGGPSSQVGGGGESGTPQPQGVVDPLDP